MKADVDPSIREIWFYRVSEMKSPFEQDGRLLFILHAIMLAIAVLSKVFELVDRKSVARLLIRNEQPATTSERNIGTNSGVQGRVNTVVWVILIAITVCYTIFAVFAYRMLPYSFMFGSILIAEFGMSSRFTMRLSRSLRIVLTFFMATAFVFIATWLEGCGDEKNDDTTASSPQKLFQEIDNLSNTPAVIMANSNDGPLLLYYTKHSVVGAPYHRHVNGIINSFKVMEDKFCESEVKKILILTDASYIFVRKTSAGEKAQQLWSLPDMIINGKPPAWISVDRCISEKFRNIIVAKIDRNMIREKK
jgi:hypothetical protein